MRRAAAVLALVTTVLWAGPAPAAPGSLASACQLDFQLFCPDLDPESPRAQVEACLTKYKDTLTEECRAVLDPASIPRPGRGSDALGAVCSEDFRRLCGHEADRMSFARCVRRHRDDLSPACRDALDVRAPRPGGPGLGSRP